MEFNSSKPIWQQLLQEFRRLIATEKWANGQKLPSTRELALIYKVNPNTVQRALSELDRLGDTYSERTTGRVVALNSGRAQALQQELAGEVLMTAAAQVQDLGITKTQAITILTERWGTND